MSNLEASFSILAQKGVMLYILKGTLFTLIIALIAVSGNCHRFRTGPVQELLHKQNYENIWHYRHRIHRSVPEYTVTAVDLHLPGVLPLPGAVQPEAVRTDHGRDEAAV